MALLLLLLCVLPTANQPCEADVWERNHFINKDGTECLCQVVIWKWERREGVEDYFIAGWALDNKCSRPERVNGRWVGRVDKSWVRAKVFYESWGFYDVEVDDRARLETKKRSGLR